MSTIPQNEATVAAPEIGGTVNFQPTSEPTAEQPTPEPSATTEVKETTTDISNESSLSNTPTPSINVVISPPKSTEELIAERAVRRVVRKTAVREMAEGHKRAGDILFESKNYKASYPQYLEAIQLWGSNPRYFISLAAAYRKLQWYEEAAHSATRALTLDPKNSEARYVRGVARMEQRLLKPARIDFETVLKHDPSHFRARAALTEVTHFIAQLGSHELDPNPVDEIVDFGFPHYDGEALEIASVSDSSDCNHVGNGVQCRFYNHDGCGRGTTCAYSHAPDEKSVRDDLGRNVCTYFLLDQCKFGPAKCIYSHSKEALPKVGWWTSEEQIAKVRSVIEVAEKKTREQRQLETERWKARIKSLKAAGRPPKSAGIKPAGKNKSGDASPVEEKPGVAADVAPTTADDSQKAPKKNQGAKTNGRKSKPHSGKKKNPKSSSITTSSHKVEEAQAPPKEDGTAVMSAPEVAGVDAPGFTDYQLNLPPVATEPTVVDAPVALQY